LAKQCSGIYAPHIRVPVSIAVDMMEQQTIALIEVLAVIKSHKIWIGIVNPEKEKKMLKRRSENEHFGMSGNDRKS
jgi:uncharacterized protein involved in tolerance to divalent cations